ncbi:class I SAM-dependent DNA methyltransferase [Roseicella aquatilis]|uniref:site-specific DNA-methyltransferase (adenine-specific) n=1 Tax=Roseicella aquatilis TaxID=2527868 RepID=A0A4R4DQB9_9PROT|nr:type IIL restriction-modification enzyme MmeI [Roseicella aquatilis]TCZ64299.1 class I SAM-dependent DNA methyltransferase [Roseicella aquatilis]
MRDPIGSFIARWDGTEQAERANYIPFLNDLCTILGVPPPDPAAGPLGDYRYERGVTHREADGATTTRRIDLYKRGCFVLEAKQGANAPRQGALFGAGEAERRANVRRSPGWAQAMLKAKGQAEGYARDLPAAEGWPPFVIVCDVGFCLDVYADFSGTGKHYAQFPDREGFRIYLPDLRRPEVRDRLHTIWTDPMALDPSRQRVRVTRDIAEYLARLARALEGPKDKPRHAPQHVATFLMRCIFSMFAQSVGLLPSGTAFTELLEDCRKNPKNFVPLVGDLWRSMNTGGFSPALRAMVLRFNGGLFAPGVHGAAEPLPVDGDMLELLIQASRRDWADVEPAIFGTLLENALDPKQRGELGAHFTPRAFVERLVLPTVMEPLRAEWDGVKAAAVLKVEGGDRAGGAALVRAFHARLCAVRVLDPACGTGNFLYVTLELMKRLEGEVLDLLADLAPGEGDRLDVAGASVDPHQFLGIEKNPRAVPVAELVLWIGHLQWHFRTRGSAPPAEPILRDFRNIREGDALLTYNREEPDRDAKGDPVTRWGGRTKVHPITGENVPDETDRVLVLRPVGAKPTQWPEAEFIVSNFPFVAGKDLRAELGDGYAEALWATYPKVPASADLAMHFWWKSAQAVTKGKVPVTRRAGFITSNSIRQVFCRRVVGDSMEAKPPVHLAFAIPDHPWADGHGAAAVRISMTVIESGPGEGNLAMVTSEAAGADGVPVVTFTTMQGRINADLSLGADVKTTKPLRANERLASPGVKLHGAGFLVTPQQAKALGLGSVPGLEAHIRPYLNGRDLQQRSRGLMVIDLDGLREDEVRQRFPAVYQHVLLHVKPERDLNNEAYRRENWWLFGRNNAVMRAAVRGLRRFIATVETAKHRVFVFLPAEVRPDNMLIAIGSDDAFVLGVLQSRIHEAWFLAACGWLGVGNDPRYNKTQVFDPFPFPNATAVQRAEIATIAEELDAHRKARLATQPHLSLTGLYNVLAAIRAGKPLSAAEKDVHDAGQVSILRALHDRLDAAVAASYGWPADLSDAAVVARVVALNAERVKEEAAGTVRWLRPEFQAPEETRRKAVQTEMAVGETAAPGAVAWPKDVPSQFIALRSALTRGPASAQDVSRRFKGAPRGAKMAEMLATLAALGQARPVGNGRYVA